MREGFNRGVPEPLLILNQIHVINQKHYVKELCNLVDGSAGKTC